MSEFEFEPVHRAGKSHNNADALSRLPTVAQSEDLDLSIAGALARLPKVSYEELNYFYWWGHDPESVCIKCETSETKKNDDILICDYCAKNIHQKCHKPKIDSIPEEPWYCLECRTAADQLEHPDVTLDFLL